MRDETEPADDAALLQALRAGERGAFEHLVQRHQRLVWHLVGRLVHNREDTRELAQEVFLRVFRTLHQFRGESQLSTWIGRIAWTIAVRHLEARRITVVPNEPSHDGEGDDDGPWPAALASALAEHDTEAQAAQRQLAVQLHRHIDSLPPLQRLLLTLHHLHELPVADIAAITGLPAGTVKSHLFRAREALRTRLMPPES
jgi:RNA polymerase sigma factor (sigma-70 family)